MAQSESDWCASLTAWVWIPWTLMKKPGAEVNACHPSAGEVEMGGPLGLAGKPGC